jgi:hypothetical protein
MRRSTRSDSTIQEKNRKAAGLGGSGHDPVTRWRSRAASSPERPERASGERRAAPIFSVVTRPLCP